MCRRSDFGIVNMLFFFSSRRRHTRLQGDWSSDVVLFRSSAWKPFVVGDYRARLFDFELRGSVQQATNWIDITKLEVVIDMPDRIESGNDLAVPAGGLKIGRASCRERGEMWGVAEVMNKEK